MRSIILIACIALSQLASFAQTVTWTSVRPHTTDANIPEDSYNISHYIGRSSVDTMNALVVFLPGTYRKPADYLFVMGEMAKMGYRVIGLMYKTDPPINPICRSTDDETCHFRARMENVDGVDRHTSVTVDATNSILNRLSKMLQYLITTHPSDNWQQFYSSGQLQWNKIIVTGHSQGASLAGVIGKQFPAKRVVMWSVMDYLTSGKIPSWVNSTTNHENYYAFMHPKDEQIPFTAAQIGWDKLGMTEYGSMVNIDCSVYPFNNSHILYTTYEPTTTQVDKHHNGTVLDVYIEDETAYKNSLKEAIKYFFRK
jgi:hypothetical protein